MYNASISKYINKDVDNNEIYIEIESIKSQTNNETFNAELELDNLSENGAANAGSSIFGFGIYNTGDAKFVRKSRLNQQESQLDQNFSLDDKNDPPKKSGKIKTS